MEATLLLYFLLIAFYGNIEQRAVNFPNLKIV